MRPVIYDAYQSCADALFPMQCISAATETFLQAVRPWHGNQVVLRGMAAGCNMFAQASISHTRPPFGIDQVTMGGRKVAASEEVTGNEPFCTLRHFKKAV